MTDAEFEVLMQEKKANKKAIKNAGFCVKVVKKSYRLFDAKRNLVAEKPTYHGEMETVKYFASLINN